MLAVAQHFYEQLAKRRSVRDFSERPVDPAIINYAIRAAGTAPNGAHYQPWHFAVVSSLEMKRTIREAAEEEDRAFYNERTPDEWLDTLAPLGTNKGKPFFETAPYLIAIFAKRQSIAADGTQKKKLLHQRIRGYRHRYADHYPAPIGPRYPHPHAEPHGFSQKGTWPLGCS